jgi:EAL domain-containing protein (putative c-di-GMP-specific phosphodiesterase class I)/CheY-like chemotaxis protein
MTDNLWRLLVVDDERIQRLIVTRVAESIGFTVDGAADFDAAAEWLARRRYDAIALDLALGAREGVSLLHMLRGADPLDVLISGMDIRGRVASCRPAGRGTGPAACRRHGKADCAGHVACDAARCAAACRAPCPRGRGSGQRGPVAVPSVAELAEAPECGDITVAFRPKVELISRQVVGLEALARWQPAERAPVPPDLFVPLAERHGLIAQLTGHVLRKSLGAYREWRDWHPGCGVAVNISPLVLANPTLPEEIEAALQEAGVASGVLITEITEGAAIADLVLAAEVLRRLRIKGVRLSLDDFGTGHSSLLSLMRLPFNVLKIDRSFVTGCETDPETWKIIRATISRAHELGLDVVAEGVESASGEERLIGAGCDIGQGWRFGRPMAGAAVEAWFDASAVTAHAVAPV